jgi:hypothetical protein
MPLNATGLPPTCQRRLCVQIASFEARRDDATVHRQWSHLSSVLSGRCLDLSLVATRPHQVDRMATCATKSTHDRDFKKQARRSLTPSSATQPWTSSSTWWDGLVSTACSLRLTRASRTPSDHLRSNIEKEGPRSHTPSSTSKV